MRRGGFGANLGAPTVPAQATLGWPNPSRRVHLATPNYSYEKRQRELAKKRKAEEKRQRKLSGKPDEPGSPDEPQGDGEATTTPADPAEPQT